MTRFRPVTRSIEDGGGRATDMVQEVTRHIKKEVERELWARALSVDVRAALVSAPDLARGDEPLASGHEDGGGVLPGLVDRVRGDPGVVGRLVVVAVTGVLAPADGGLAVDELADGALEAVGQVRDGGRAVLVAADVDDLGVAPGPGLVAACYQDLDACNRGTVYC